MIIVLTHNGKMPARRNPPRVSSRQPAFFVWRAAKWRHDRQTSRGITASGGLTHAHGQAFRTLRPVVVLRAVSVLRRRERIRERRSQLLRRLS